MDTYYQEEDKKTDEELAESASNIEPEWTRARAKVEKVMEKFSVEDFTPIVDKVIDEFHKRLCTRLSDFLIADTEEGIVSHIRYRVERTVQALLQGDKWAIERYVLDAPNYADGQAIREAIAKLIPQELQDKRLRDMQLQMDQLKEELDRERNWNRR